MTKVEEQYLFYLQPADDVCFLDDTREITRRQLLSEIGRLAQNYTLSPGGRVMVLCENRPEWAAAFLSAWFQRGVAVPVDAMASTEDIAYILGDCEPDVVLCSAKTLESAKKSMELAKSKVKLLNLDELHCTFEATKNPAPMPHHEPEELALLIYTSGTTSAAKGCMITFHNLEINFKSMTEDVPVWLPDQTTVALLPLHHIFPLQGCLLMPLHRKGCRIVFLSTLSGPEIIKAVRDNRVTVLIAVPRVFQMFRDSLLKKIRSNPIGAVLFALSKAVGNLRFSRFLFRPVQEAFGGCIRFFPTGGAALDYRVYDDLHAMGFEMLPGSGMSEAAPVVAFTRQGRSRRDSAGQLVSIIEGKIAEDGEILLKGEGIIHEYWRKPKETAEAFDADGWLHTGDLGRLDEDNYLFYTGRKKELIILSNGKNVPPLVIEDKLMDMSDLVEEVAVVPCGDVLGALILPDMAKIRERHVVNIAETIEQEVIAPYNQKSEPYLRILKTTYVTTPFPRTRLGKLQRHKLAAFAADAANPAKRAAVPEPDSEEYRIVRDVLKDFLQQKSIRPDDHFEIDLGIDSLGKVELLVALSGAFGMELTEQMLGDAPTPKALAEFIAAHRSELAAAGENRSDWGTILQQGTPARLPQCSFTHYPLNLLSQKLQKLLFHVEQKGLENIPDGPCIFACNHQSVLDGLFVMGAFDRKTLADTCFYAKQRHVDNFFARYMAAHHNVIVVDMNTDVKGSLCKLAAVLKSGKKVAIFPEGTRTLTGELGNFKNTFAILAKELQCPIVPVAIDGAYEAMPRGQHFPKFFSPIQVTFLPGSVPKKNKEYAEIAHGIAEQIRGAMKRA